MDIFSAKPNAEVDVVCPIEQYDVYESHAANERHDTEQHDLVLGEEAVVAQQAATHARADDGQRR